jgi:CubicO group peptidase (beta-lactamase class C family)
MSYQPEILKTYLDEYLPAKLAETRIPGFALAVIADGAIREMRGYGYRDLENKLPVDTDTQFAIGSSSKAFTAALLAQLVDEGRLNWEDRVRDILPEFRLKDPVAEAEMNIIDLMCHRGGMVRGDLAWIFLHNASRSELIHKMRHFDTEFPFRSRFSYNNYMWLTAGVVAERVTGRTWEELVQERIFVPLGMNANCSVNAMEKVGNRSFGYTDDGENLLRLPYRNIDTMGPAGSINANIQDYARWLQFNVNKGRVGERQLISEKNMEMTFAPHTPILPGHDMLKYTGMADFKALKSFGYGLGWFYMTLHDHRVLGHGGNIDGFSAWLQFLPDDGVGVAMLTNADQNLAHYTICMEVVERLLGCEPQDWLSQGIKKYHEGLAEKKQGKESLAAMQVKDTQPSHKLPDYAGKYHHPAYGDLAIELQDAQLRCTIWGMPGALQHFHYDTFLLKLDTPYPDVALPATFNFDLTGQVVSVSLPLDEGRPAVVFTRLSETQ